MHCSAVLKLLHAMMDSYLNRNSTGMQVHRIKRSRLWSLCCVLISSFQLAGPFSWCMVWILCNYRASQKGTF